MVMRVVVLGAGFGGLELATTVSERCGQNVDLTLIDKAEGFVFGYSKLDVMFGRARPDQVLHRYTGLKYRFVSATVTAIDPTTRRVETDKGSFDADILVVALGADLHPDKTPGLLEHGNEFYTVNGAFEARDTIANFRGGRVVVAVTSTPFKCPPAPSETALLMHEYLAQKGIPSEISLVMPLGTPIPPSPEASQAVLEAFAERGITWHPERLVQRLEPNVAVLSDGGELPFDLFLGVPVHRAPEVVAPLTVDGWIPVDPLTLETSFENVYAVGDVTSVGTPKAGVFAEGQAAVVAERIVATIEGDASSAQYDGRGVCYLEFGHDRVAKVDVRFRAGERPVGALIGPSADLVGDKTAFGRDRVRRWFGKDQ